MTQQNVKYALVHNTLKNRNKFVTSVLEKFVDCGIVSSGTYNSPVAKYAKSKNIMYSERDSGLIASTLAISEFISFAVIICDKATNEIIDFMSLSAGKFPVILVRA